MIYQKFMQNLKYLNFRLRWCSHTLFIIAHWTRWICSLKQRSKLGFRDWKVCLKTHGVIGKEVILAVLVKVY